MQKKTAFFETLSETEQGSLVGGFSTALTSAPTTMTVEVEANNCSGQNCAAFCGVLQNHGACNSVPGCGKSL